MWSDRQHVELLFRETSTFGIRTRTSRRVTLERCFETVGTPYGLARIKVGLLGGEAVTRSPEQEDCARLAAEAGVPLKRVMDAARSVEDRAGGHGAAP